MKRKILAGTTSLLDRVLFVDASGTPVTGLTYSDIAWHYCRLGDSDTTEVTAVTATLGTFTSSGFIQVDATDMPGVYEIGIPDAAIAAGSSAVHLCLQAAGALPVYVMFELDGVDYQNGDTFGLTGLVVSHLGDIVGEVVSVESNIELEVSFDAAVLTQYSLSHLPGMFSITFFTGSGIGITRLVSGFNDVGSIITLYTNLPPVVSPGDRFILSPAIARVDRMSQDVITATSIAASAIGSTQSPALANLDEAVSTRAAAATALSTSVWTAARAGYIDNINVSGLVASQADVQAITVSSRVRISIPPLFERPDSSSTAYRIWIYHYGSNGTAENLDANPTVTAENNAGTDRSTNLGSVQKADSPDGVYYVDYTVAAGHATEGLVFKVSATEDEVTSIFAESTIVVDTTAVDFTSADRAKLNTLHDDRLTAARAGYLDKLNVAGTLAHTGNASSFMADTSGLVETTDLPANFGSLVISGSGVVEASVASIAENAITSSAIASAALSGKGDWTTNSVDTAAILEAIGEIEGGGGGEVTGFSPSALAQIGSLQQIVIGVPALVGNRLSQPLIRGDSYLSAHDRALTFSRSDFPDLAGTESVSLTAQRRHCDELQVITLSGSIEETTGTKVLAFEIASTVSAEWEPGEYEFDVEVLFADGNSVTFAGPALLQILAGLN